MGLAAVHGQRVPRRWANAASEGFTRPAPTVVFVATVLSTAASPAMRHIPTGTAYAVWTSVGTVLDGGLLGRGHRGDHAEGAVRGHHRLRRRPQAARRRTRGRRHGPCRDAPGGRLEICHAVVVPLSSLPTMSRGSGWGCRPRGDVDAVAVRGIQARALEGMVLEPERDHVGHRRRAHIRARRDPTPSSAQRSLDAERP